MEHLEVGFEALSMRPVRRMCDDGTAPHLAIKRVLDECQETSGS